MKRLLLLSCFLCSFYTWAQSTALKPPPVDKSGMDMSHYPVNYPILKIQNKITEPLAIRVVYSRPSKSGRVVFGELVEYGKVWRLGANEATEIEFFRDARIGNTKVKKGRYSLYAIPETDKWTMILNKETDTWGAFQYDAKKDVLRTDIPVKKLEEEVESFSLYFEKNNNSIQMIMAWDKTKASLPITLL